MRERPTALVYRPGSLGDTLVSLPAIAEIRRRYPDHRLTLLTENPVAGSTRVSPWTILKETGWFDAVHFYVVKPASAADRYRNIALALRLRAHKFHDIFSLAPPRTRRQLRVDHSIFRGVVGARRYHAAPQARAGCESRARRARRPSLAAHCRSERGRRRAAEFPAGSPGLRSHDGPRVVERSRRPAGSTAGGCRAWFRTIGHGMAGGALRGRRQRPASQVPERRAAGNWRFE
jgi:hypothetical protein